jgi:hypothetical protein
VFSSIALVAATGLSAVKLNVTVVSSPLSGGKGGIGISYSEHPHSKNAKAVLTVINIVFIVIMKYLRVC